MIDSTNLSTPGGPADGTPASPGARRKLSGCGCLFALVIPAVILAATSGFFFMMIPASQKLTKPLVCAEAVDMVITTDVTRRGDGESQITSKAYCIDAEDRAWPAPMGKMYGIYTGGMFLVLLGVVGILRLATHRPTPHRPGLRP